MTPFRVYLTLGRVSNLPTVWTNTLAGIVLAGGVFAPRTYGLLALGMSLFYVGGMFLNDAFDRGIDAVERPERPIPSGKISATEVFAIGFLLMAGGAVLTAMVRVRAIAPALGLGAAIVLYDAWHKKNPLSPLIMGLCRVLVYVTAAFASATEVQSGVWIGAVVLLCYLIGLTYVAKQENLTEVKNLWPLLFLGAPLAMAPSMRDAVALVVLVALVGWVVRCVLLVRERKPGNISRAVVGLIAGISLLDALLVAKAGRPELATIGGVGFFLTLAGQKYVKGT